MTERLERLLAEATPGPWVWESGALVSLTENREDDEHSPIVWDSDSDFFGRDFDLLTAAVNALPLLLDVAEAAEEYYRVRQLPFLPAFPTHGEDVAQHSARVGELQHKAWIAFETAVQRLQEAGDGAE